MEFYEKLTFLLQITNTNNNELAEAIGVGPSIVSLYKTDRRPMPKKTNKLRNLAKFFGSLVLNKYQRQALSEKTRNTLILTHYEPCDIEEAIYCWFLDKQMPEDGSTQRMVMAMHNPNKVHNQATELTPAMQTTRIYSGPQGKADALRDFMSHILTVEHPTTLYIHGDDNRDWFYQDPNLNAQVVDTIRKLISRGCKIQQVLPPTNNEFLLDIFSKWLPAYVSGDVTPYYYPRFRDHVFRGFQYALENCAGLISYGIHNGHARGFAAMVTEQPLINDVVETVKDMIRISIPALNVYKDYSSIYHCFETLHNIPLSQLGFRNSLPLESLPKNEIEQLKKQYDNSDIEKITKEFYSYENKLSSQVHVDIFKLANARQVRAGKVKIPLPGVPLEDCPNYTPTSYSKHLRNIVNLLQKYDKYYVAPLPLDSVFENTIFVKKDTKAIVVNNNPFIAYEVTTPELVKAFQEHLLRKVDNILYKENGKKLIISQLNTVINDLKH